MKMLSGVRTVHVLLGVAMAATVLVLLGGPASANPTLVVNSEADKTDANPGDGVCSTGEDLAGGSAECTLRAAVQEAESLEGADTITVPTGTYTLSLQSPGEDYNSQLDSSVNDLDLYGDISVLGADARSTIISAPGIHRAIHIGSGGVTLKSVTIRDAGIAGVGGTGLSVRGDGTALVQDVEVRNNGGYSAVRHQDTGYGTFLFKKSTVADNATSHFAVELSGRGGYSNPTAEFTNLTISGNSAPEYAVYVAQQAQFRNVTIAGNGSRIGVYVNRWYWGSSMHFSNVIIADHQTDCLSENGSSPNYGAGNLIETNNNCTFSSGEQATTGVDPSLATLDLNGGQTRTRALSETSPALDAGSNSDCSATDQRGVARPADGNGDGISTCDIGAYEWADADADTVEDGQDPDPADNCDPNPAFASCDLDADTTANRDDLDDDGDGQTDASESACESNAHDASDKAADFDKDDDPDCVDEDDDNDGVDDADDLFDSDPNESTDNDGDGDGDNADTDDDNDGVLDVNDRGCTTLAEDNDGIEDSDGCPET
ncbi:MAG: right-handed parallel beta-helix repeat-containing protein, partial [Actinomycetota bacterium]|nr:right-handed parallel beta-helix repeat-containing protein [Actinomycetota bacterium]